MHVNLFLFVDTTEKIPKKLINNTKQLIIFYYFVLISFVVFIACQLISVQSTFDSLALSGCTLHVFVFLFNFLFSTLSSGFGR